MLVDNKKEEYERMIRTAEEQDDPLSFFYSYILFLKEIKEEERYFELLKETTNLFCLDQRYKNDPRYVHCFILYSEKIINKEEVYLFMKEKGIGLFVSLYYESYSQFLEVKGKIEEAFYILKKGVSNKATPLKRLEKTLETFIQRNKVSPRECKGYNEKIIEEDISFEEWRERDREETLENFISQNKEDILFLDSENSSDLCLFPLVPGVDNDFTQIDIFKDNTMDTRELHLKHLTCSKNILKEKIISEETSPFSDLSQVEFSIEQIPHSKAIELMNESSFGNQIDSSGFEMIKTIEAILRKESYERSILFIDKEKFFVQKKIGKKEDVFVYLSLDIGSGSSSGSSSTENSKVVLKAKKEGLRGEKFILERLCVNRIAPKPISLIEYSDVSFLVMESIESLSLLQIRKLLCKRREREATSISIFFSLRTLQAIRLLHCTGIIHGDISCENILPCFGDPAIKEEKSSFSSTDPVWCSRGIFLCGFSRAIDIGIVGCDVSEICINSLCSTEKHSSCFEADLHCAAYVILLLILPHMNVQISGINELRTAIENTSNSEMFAFKEMWKEILVLLLNKNQTREDCLNVLSISIEKLEKNLEEYDRPLCLDSLAMSLKRIEMDMYEDSFN